MTGSPYARLRDAVLAYDRALKAYGLLGEHWQESPKLDDLYATMLAATEPGGYGPVFRVEVEEDDALPDKIEGPSDGFMNDDGSYGHQRAHEPAAPSQAGPCDSCEHGRDHHAFFPAQGGTLGEPAPLCYGADEDEAIATCECEGYFAPTPVQP